MRGDGPDEVEDWTIDLRVMSTKGRSAIVQIALKGGLTGRLPPFQVTVDRTLNSTTQDLETQALHQLAAAARSLRDMALARTFQRSEG